MPMELGYDCPQCGTPGVVTDAEESGVLSCSRCGYVGLLPATWALEGRVERCPICGRAELYKRKDLHQRLLILVVFGGIALALFTRYLSLFAAAFLGGIIYLVSPEVLVCYACEANIRGHGSSSGHARYDPETAARIRGGSDRQAEHRQP